MPRLLYQKIGHTGEATSEPVRMPDDVDFAYTSIILSAPVRETNIFDLSVAIDVLENGAWRERDGNLFTRGLADADTPIHYTSTARLERIAGKLVRARIAVGQSLVAVCVAIQ